MAKRGPQSELTDRNWDHEDEPEEAGIFKQASNDIIQNRVIKKAKRRGISDESGQKSSPFGAFAGLVNSRPDLKASEERDTPKTFGDFGAKTTTFKAGIFSGATSSADHEETPKSDSKDSSYMQSLKSLNESVLAWIKKHVEQNPYIILTPVFKDYEKHVVTIEGKKNPVKSVMPDSALSKPTTAEADSKSISNSPNSKVTEDANKKDEAKANSKDEGKAESTSSAKSSLFQFGSTASSPNGSGFKFSSSSPNTFSSGFSFGKTTAPPISGGFSFAQSTNNGTTKVPSILSSSGFSFGAVSSLSTGTTPGFGSVGGGASTSTTNDDDEEYVPPKPEVKEIKEADSLYSQKCKMFYKKEDKWADRGVGNVHLKPIGENKTQILIRADTNLGNILLNIMLMESMPMSRQGKNNVLLVCTPNPPLKEDEKDPKPVPMLIRVKSAEVADELMAKLEERKKLIS